MNARLVDASDDFLAVGISRNDDAHDVGPALAYLAQKLHTGLSRHALITQNDVDWVLFQEAAGIVRTAGGDDGEVILKRATQRFLRTLLVIHDQNRRHRRLR